MSGENEHTGYDPYWTDDCLLAEDVQVERGPHLVRAHVHRSRESYPARYGRSEIVPISDAPGSREYVHIHPYILVPDIRFTIGLYEHPAPSGAIGDVTHATWEGMRPIQVGNGQAWYYPSDRTLILWELDLFPHFHQHPDDPLADATYLTLWRGFEAYLLTQFPDAHLLATPSWEPGVERSQWQAFLSALAYTELTARAFGKPLV